MRIHFIAIGGSIMHQLAIWLAKEGYVVSGSDDVIYEPALTNLRMHNLLPRIMGFRQQNVQNAELVILGMHAKADNPEYRYAKEHGIPLFSFAEYVYSRITNKLRVVIAGSHGKTTTTAMLAHMLNSQAKCKFDLLLGAEIAGITSSVQLYPDSELSILEGDEYPAAINNPIPKFLCYKPHIAVITGIAWDHINAFPNFELYKQQFSQFIQSITPGGKLIYNSLDPHIAELIKFSQRKDLQIIPYSLPDYRHDSQSGITYLHNPEPVPLRIFGEHNLANLAAAMGVIEALGWEKSKLVASMPSFVGAKLRMECVLDSPNLKVYRDFAHSPSKLQAAIQAIYAQYPKHPVFLCFELHTYSSLNAEFLHNYSPILKQYPELLIYCSASALRHKQSAVSIAELGQILGIPAPRIIDNPDKLRSLLEQLPTNSVALLMSSGNFDNLEFGKLRKLKS